MHLHSWNDSQFFSCWYFSIQMRMNVLQQRMVVACNPASILQAVTDVHVPCQDLYRMPKITLYVLVMMALSIYNGRP